MNLNRPLSSLIQEDIDGAFEQQVGEFLFRIAYKQDAKDHVIVHIYNVTDGCNFYDDDPHGTDFERDDKVCKHDSIRLSIIDYIESMETLRIMIDEFRSGKIKLEDYKDES